MGTGNKPLNIIKAAIEHAKANDINVVILDTAGRLQIDFGYVDDACDRWCEK